MIPQYAPGMLIPFIYETMTLDEVKQRAPKLSVFYEVQTARGSALPEFFTGKALGGVYFINGKARVRTLYEKRILLMRGCIDRTSKEMKELLKQRNLKRILVIRNAAFGDVTMITPALVALRKKYPEATIHFYGREDSRDVILFNHHVDGIIDVRTTEIGALLNDYDEIYDMVHTIECNPTADYKTALDVAHDYLMLDKPDGSKNFYQFNKPELDEALSYLAKLGINPNKEMIFFQFEGTAMARSLSPLTTYKVAQSLAEKGYQVLLWSHKDDFANYDFFVCEETGGMTAQITENKQDLIIELENKNGKKTKHRRLKKHENIKFILRDRNNEPMKFGTRRGKFAISYFAAHFLTVDSFFSHLANALDKTSTIIFTNYHPYTRTKYYHNSNVVHVDFKEQLPCGPCNGLMNDCPLTPGQLPKCSALLSADKIVEATLMRLKRENNLFEEMRDFPSIPEDYEDHSHHCKVCDSEDTQLITVKANVPYHRCLSCHSIFANNKRYTSNWKFLRNPYYTMSRNIENPETLYGVIKNHLQDKSSKISDISRISDKERLGKSSKLNTYLGGIFEEYLLEEEKPLNEASILFDLMMEFETHSEFVNYVMKRTKPKDKIFVVLPVANKWDFSNKWKPILQPIAGMNQIIYSEEAMLKLFGGTKGIYSDKLKITAVNEINAEITMYCLERL